MTEWFRMWSREYSVQYSELVVRLVEGESHPSVRFCKSIMMVTEGKNQSCYFLLEEYKKWEATIKKEICADFKGFLEEYERFGEKYLAIAKRVAESDELLEAYKEHYEAWLEYTAYLFVGFVAADHMIESLESIDESLTEYVTPWRRVGILAMQDKIRESENPEELYEECKWISCMDIHNKPWTMEQFKEFIASIPEKEEVTVPDMDQEKKQIFDLACKALYLKDIRDVYRRKGMFYFQKLFKRIAASKGLTVDEAAYLTKEEILSSVDKDVIGKRKQGFLVCINDGTECFCGEEMRAELEKRRFKAEGKDTECKGKPAFKGVVAGIAKIVEGVADLEKVQEGNILITVTTHPDFVPAMQRAAAFVTNEGGISSHAAIVAREVKKPCIVGTGNATRMFKDGDLVEVDADEGLVRKVSG